MHIHTKSNGIWHFFLYVCWTHFYRSLTFLFFFFLIFSWWIQIQSSENIVEKPTLEYCVSGYFVFSKNGKSLTKTEKFYRWFILFLFHCINQVCIVVSFTAKIIQNLLKIKFPVHIFTIWKWNEKTKQNYFWRIKIIPVFHLFFCYEINVFRKRKKKNFPCLTYEFW